MNFNKLKVLKYFIWFAIVILGIIFCSIIIYSLHHEWHSLFDNNYWSTHSGIISSVGVVLTIILAVIPILLVLVGSINEKEEKKKELEQYYGNISQVIINFLEQIIDDIFKIGIELKEIVKEEKNVPTRKDYSPLIVDIPECRYILEMDKALIYNVFDYKFKKDQGWKKHYIDLYSLLSLYDTFISRYRAEYETHIKDKFTRILKVNECFQKLLSKVEECHEQNGGQEFSYSGFLDQFNDVLPKKKDKWDFMGTMVDNLRANVYSILDNNQLDNQQRLDNQKILNLTTEIISNYKKVGSDAGRFAKDTLNKYLTYCCGWRKENEDGTYEVSPLIRLKKIRDKLKSKN